jgi:hypothetical protein
MKSENPYEIVRVIRGVWRVVRRRDGRVMAQVGSKDHAVALRRMFEHGAREAADRPPGR